MHIFSLLITVTLSSSLLAAALPSLLGIKTLVNAKRTLSGTQLTQCDLASAVLPTIPGNTTALPAPNPSSTLKHVLLGRGTQNYTCTDTSSSSTAAPAAAGAVALLYDVSCLAAGHSKLLNELTPMFLQFDQSFEMMGATVMGQVASESFVMGHHFFAPDPTTPTFDLFGGDLFAGDGKTAKKATAPSDAVKGSDNKGDGAVDWLYLTPKTGADSRGIKETYRVVTAGGKPPKTCAGLQSQFAVDYAAEYWFYG